MATMSGLQCKAKRVSMEACRSVTACLSVYLLRGREPQVLGGPMERPIALPPSRTSSRRRLSVGARRGAAVSALGLGLCGGARRSRRSARSGQCWMTLGVV